MKLRTKTGIIICITTISLTAILYHVSLVTVSKGLKQIEKTILEGYLHIENDDAKRNMKRVIDSYSYIKSNLAVKGSDWSNWDDTYRFMSDHNEAYLASNISIGTLTSLNINGMALIDNKSRTLVQIMTRNGDSLTYDIAGCYLNSIRNRADSGVKTISGLFYAYDIPLIFASLPVHKSDGSGPSRGRIIFFKAADSSLFEEIAKLTHLDIGWKIHRDTVCTLSTISDRNDSVFTFTPKDSVLTGTAVLHDITNKPLITINVTMFRHTMRHARVILEAVKSSGNSTVLSLVISIIITGIILTLVIFLVLEKVVLKRLAQISQKSAEIGKNGIHSERLPLSGKDEVTSLSHSINGMLAALEISHESLSKRDLEKKMLMNNVPLGILSLNDQLLVNPEYSKCCQDMFGVDECAGRHIGDILALTGNNEQLLSDLTAFLELMRQQVVAEKESAVLNPLGEFHFMARNLDRWYTTQFHAISGTPGTPHLLMIIRDITEEKHLDQEMQSIHEENVQLKRITENPDFFREFMQETKDGIARSKKIADELEPSPSSLTSIGALFRNLHTIKGVAGSFGLKNIESITGNAEELLSGIMDQQEIALPVIRQIRQIILELEAAFGETMNLSSSLLGDLLSDDGFSVRIPVSKINALLTTLSQLNQDCLEKSSEKEEMIRTMIAKLKAIPASVAFSRSVRIIPSLCERLDKSARLIFTGGSTRIDFELAQKMNVVLMHLFRNALDHGIESPEIRLQRGKDEQGVLSICVDQPTPHHLSITISDDGAGLNYSLIRTTARKLNLLSESAASSLSPAELAQYIFLPGFTTALHVTEISGRGVGLDIVASIIKNDLGGAISVSSAEGNGTVFLVTLPC